MDGRWLGIAFVVAMAVAPLAAAQDGPASDTLVLTSKAPAGASAPQTEGCPTLNLYEMVEPEDEPSETSKAYLTRTTVVLSCRTQFYVDPPGAFNLTGESTASLFVGCEETTAFLPVFPDVNVELNRNGKAITSGSAELSATCSPGSPLEADVAMDPPEDPAFAATDTIRLNVTVFGSPGWVTENLHVLAGGETPSSLVLPGLAEAYETEDVEEKETGDEDDQLGNDTGIEQASADDGGNGTPGPTALATVLAIGLVARLAAGRRT